jgi:hypothetical protein
MDIDLYIAELEDNIKNVKNKIKSLEVSSSLDCFSKIPIIKTCESQLPFKVIDFPLDFSIKNVKDHLLEGSNKFKDRKIIPIPGLEASFCYDFFENISTWQGPMQLIYGLGNTCESSFEEILGLVVFRDKQRFQDVVFDSVGRKNTVSTKPILLENGNIITEKYDFIYHKEDYERRSPILLQGKSRLIGIDKGF